MKYIKQLSFIISLAALTGLVACEMAIPPFGPTDRPDTGETPVVPPTEVPDTAGWNVPIGALSVADARAICAELESGATSGESYYVMGWVKKLHTKHAEGVSGYGNAQFYMEDVKGANSSDDFMAFQVYGPNKQRITDPNAVAVGDFVVIYGELTNYKGTYETVGKGTAYIWKSTNSLLAEAKPEPEEVTLLDRDLSKTNALDTFTVTTTKGSAKWKYNRTGKCSQANGADSETLLITPALDMSAMSEATVDFKYKFSEVIPAEYQSQYTVLVSNDYAGDVEKATWVELEGLSYETTTYAETGAITIPSDMIGTTCHIAWKYSTAEVSHTWALKSITIKAMTKVE